MRKFILGAFFVVTTVGCLGVGVAEGQAAIKYQKPTQGIETLLEAPATPIAAVSPDKKMMAMEQPETLSTIAEVSQPRMRLAGLRFNPLTNGQTAVPYSTGLTLQTVGGGAPRPVTGLPATPKILYVQWSPDGRSIAFVQRVDGKQHWAPYLAALGLLLNRAPLYAGPETVVVAEFVERAYAAFRDFDWAEPQLSEFHNLFLRAARVVDDRNLDVPKSLRNQIARKLESAGIASMRTAAIRAFMPVGRIDRTTLYGEALPPGLVLAVDLDCER